MHKSQRQLLPPIIFLSILLLSVFFAFSSARAEDTDEEKVEELEKLKEKEEKYRGLIDTKQKEKSAIVRQVQQLEGQSKDIEKDIKSNEKKIEDISSDIKEVAKNITTKQNMIDAQKDLLRHMLRDHYHRTVRSVTVKSAFAESAADQNIDRVAQTTDSMRDLTTLIIDEAASLAKDREKLEENRNNVAEEKVNLEERNRHLENTKHYKNTLALEVQKEESKYKDRLDKVLLEQLAIQSEIDGIANGYIGDFKLSDLPSRKDADFDDPVRNPIITQEYGKTDFSHRYKGGHHNGKDYSGRGNRDILAIGKGKIHAIGNMGRYGYGRWIAIDHGNGLISLYGHLQKQDVKKGEKVDKGEKIGTMGTTGFSTGVHLHLSIFAKSTFKVVESSSVSGVYIPTGGTVNPNVYL